MATDTLFQEKRVLITGGLGMIGSTLAKDLVDGGARVTIVDPLLPLYGGNPFNIEPIKEKIELFSKDIRDADFMRKVVKDKDIIYNFAAQVSYIDSQLDPLLDNDINCRGHLTVLESMRKVNDAAKILFSSSRMQFGKTQYTPVDEKHPCQPLNIYGIHKLAGEKYYQMYHEIHGLDTVSFRIANPYGPRGQMKHSKYGLVNWFIRQAMEGNEIKVFGDGSQKRDYIYVGDIAEAFSLAGISKKTNGQLYNIGSGTSASFMEMVKTILRVVPTGTMKQVEWPEDYRSIEVGDFVTDIRKISEDIGWTPKTNLLDGITKTHAYYREHQGAYW